MQGVLGASEDGSYVYFVANGVLGGRGQPSGNLQQRLRSHTAAGNCNLYLWEEGQMSFIARLRRGRRR